MNASFCRFVAKPNVSFYEICYNVQLETSSWSPSGDSPIQTDDTPLATLPTVCTHPKSLSLHLYSASFTLFYPGLWPALALEHNVLSRGSFAFQSSLLFPLSTNPKGQIHPSLLPLVGHVDNLISNAGVVFLLTTQGCGSEGFVYRGVVICRHTVTCPWPG